MAKSNFNIQIGLRRASYLEYQSELLPEYSMGMVFIVVTDGRHIALSLKEVAGVCVTPITKSE